MDNFRSNFINRKTESVLMSFNVDALGGLAEKLKQLVNETQEHYEALVEDSQLYKRKD